jgi:hypothetical protein
MLIVVPNGPSRMPLACHCFTLFSPRFPFRRAFAQQSVIPEKDQPGGDAGVIGRGNTPAKRQVDVSYGYVAVPVDVRAYHSPFRGVPIDDTEVNRESPSVSGEGALLDMNGEVQAPDIAVYLADVPTCTR